MREKRRSNPGSLKDLIGNGINRAWVLPQPVRPVISQPRTKSSSYQDRLAIRRTGLLSRSAAESVHAANTMQVPTAARESAFKEEQVLFLATGRCHTRPESKIRQARSTTAARGRA